MVHGLPGPSPIAERSANMRRLGGGAGFDLDSLLTLVPAAGGEVSALLADVQLGLGLLRRMPVEDWQQLRSGYQLKPGVEELQSQLEQYQESLRAQRLSAYLEAVAEHLAASGLQVERLPHLLVPTALLAESEDLDHPDFQISWNNVVVEAVTHHDRSQTVRAEGFSSLLAQGDDEARQAFQRLGCRLDLLPPLVRSIILNGGYRCASNHLRRGD